MWGLTWASDLNSAALILQFVCEISLSSASHIIFISTGAWITYIIIDIIWLTPALHSQHVCESMICIGTHLYYLAGQIQICRVSDVELCVVSILSSVFQLNLHQHLSFVGLHNMFRTHTYSLLDTQWPCSMLLQSTELTEARAQFRIKACCFNTFFQMKKWPLHASF